MSSFTKGGAKAMSFICPISRITPAKMRKRELDTADLLEQLPSLQQLLSHLLACQPQAAAGTNCIIQLSLSLVAGESVRIFNEINDATFNLGDKFFGMKHHTLRALEIYRKARQQASNLSEFYEVCKGLDPRGAESFVKIEQSPSFFSHSHGRVCEGCSTSFN